VHEGGVPADQFDIQVTGGISGGGRAGEDPMRQLLGVYELGQQTTGGLVEMGPAAVDRTGSAPGRNRTKGRPQDWGLPDPRVCVTSMPWRTP
jgi:hypothetical protein